MYCMFLSSIGISFLFCLEVNMNTMLHEQGEQGCNFPLECDEYYYSVYGE